MKDGFICLTTSYQRHFKDDLKRNAKRLTKKKKWVVLVEQIVDDEQNLLVEGSFSVIAGNEWPWCDYLKTWQGKNLVYLKRKIGEKFGQKKKS